MVLHANKLYANHFNMLTKSVFVLIVHFMKSCQPTSDSASNLHVYLEKKFFKMGHVKHAHFIKELLKT